MLLLLACSFLTASDPAGDQHGSHVVGTCADPAFDLAHVRADHDGGLVRVSGAVVDAAATPTCFGSFAGTRGKVVTSFVLYPVGAASRWVEVSHSRDPFGANVCTRVSSGTAFTSACRAALPGESVHAADIPVSGSLPHRFGPAVTWDYTGLQVRASASTLVDVDTGALVVDTLHDYALTPAFQL